MLHPFLEMLKHISACKMGKGNPPPGSCAASLQGTRRQQPQAITYVCSIILYICLFFRQQIDVADSRRLCSVTLLRLVSTCGPRPLPISFARSYSHTSTMAFSLPRSCLVVTLALLFIISVATLALQASTLDYISANYLTGGFDLNPYDQTEPESSQRIVGLLPLHIYRGAPRFALAASLITAITSVAVLIFTVSAWPNGKRVSPRYFPPTVQAKS